MKKIIETAEENILHTYNRYNIVLDYGDGVYVYDTEDDDGVGYVDNSNQFSRKTEYDDIFIEAGNVDSLLKNAEQVRHNLYVHKVGDTNLVIFVCDNDEILYPEVVLNGLYDKELKKYTEKNI